MRSPSQSARSGAFWSGARALRGVALLLALVLAGRMLLAPAHIGHSHSHKSPIHHTDHHGTNSCTICDDLLLTKHVGPGPALTTLPAMRIDEAPLRLPTSRPAERFSLPSGARAPPAA